MCGLRGPVLGRFSGVWPWWWRFSRPAGAHHIGEQGDRMPHARNVGDVQSMRAGSRRRVAIRPNAKDAAIPIEATMANGPDQSPPDSS